MQWDATLQGLPERVVSPEAHWMTAAQRFLNLDPDSVPEERLPVIAEALLCDLIPCEFCTSWVHRRFEIEFYIDGGIEVCERCEEERFDRAAAHRFPKSEKGHW